MFKGHTVENMESRTRSTTRKKRFVIRLKNGCFGSCICRKMHHVGLGFRV